MSLFRDISFGQGCHIGSDEGHDVEDRRGVMGQRGEDREHEGGEAARPDTGAGLSVGHLLWYECVRQPQNPTSAGDAVRYLAHTLDAQWFVLPVAQQTPMSAWNRTPFQALIAWGRLAASAWLVRGRRLSFARAFAVALVLFYLGRPVGWTLVDLDVVVCVAVWPALSRAGRAVLLVGVVALLLSHWVALVLMGLGNGLPLLTLQPADRPWETWLVLPAAWALVLWAARRLTGRDPATVPSQDPMGGAMTMGGLVTTSDRS